jgi:hypothetical protein
MHLWSPSSSLSSLLLAEAKIAGKEEGKTEKEEEEESRPLAVALVVVAAVEN